MKRFFAHFIFLIVSLVISGVLYLAVPLANVFWSDKPLKKKAEVEDVIAQAIEVVPPPKTNPPKEIKQLTRQPMPSFKPQQTQVFNKPFQLDLSLASGGEGSAAGQGTGDGSGGIGGKGLGAEVYEPGQVDVQAKVLKEANPNYPARARKDGVSGYVKLYLVVDARGNAADIQVLAVDPLGYGFEQEAVKALRQFKFAPARLQDVPVAQKFTKEFIFDLGY